MIAVEETHRIVARAHYARSGKRTGNLDSEAWSGKEPEFYYSITHARMRTRTLPQSQYSAGFSVADSFSQLHHRLDNAAVAD